MTDEERVKKLRSKIREADHERGKGVMSALSRNSTLLHLEQVYIEELATKDS
jgi:hypothetical protein